MLNTAAYIIFNAAMTAAVLGAIILPAFTRRSVGPVVGFIGAAMLVALVSAAVMACWG